MTGSLLDYVRLIESKSDLHRRNQLIWLLNSKGHKFECQRYSMYGRRGINIILEFGQGPKDILATTHYDVFFGSPGANDNASCIAVLLDVADRLRSYSVKNKVKIIFFDDEETGLLGSKAYIQSYGLDNLIGLYNLELCGMGDTIGIWPVTEDVKDNFVLQTLRGTLKQMGCRWEEAGQLSAFFGDHRSFRTRGFSGAFCISVVPSDQIDSIRRFVESSTPRVLTRYYLGKVLKPLKIPLMFQLYHSPQDKSIYLNEGALLLTSDVVYNAIVNLDQNFD